MQSAIDAASQKGIIVKKRKLPKDLMKDVFGQSFLSTAIPITKFSTTTGLMCYGLYHLIKKVKR